MNETTNYKLYITDNEEEKFANWREKMNGTQDSNMIKIDAALSEKADSSTVINITLSADNWVGEAAPYTQEITVDGLTAEQNGFIGISPDATNEQQDIARGAILSIAEQEDEKLIISAVGEKPLIDLPAYIILLG